MRMVSVVALFLLAPTTVLADEALWTLLRGGGHIVLMRHSTTTPGVGDPPGFSLASCPDPAQPDRRRPGRGAAGGRGIPVPRHPGRARAVEPLVPVSRDRAPGVRPGRTLGAARLGLRGSRSRARADARGTEPGRRAARHGQPRAGHPWREHPGLDRHQPGARGVSRADPGTGWTVSRRGPPGAGLRSPSRAARRLGRRGLLRGLAASAALGTTGRPTWLWAEESGQEAMARAALAFLGTLDSRRARQATFSVHAGRAPELALRAAPAGGRAAQGHDGRRPHRRARACCRRGSRRPATPRRRTSSVLEGVLRQLETFGGFNRDPDNYAVTIFGTPGPARALGVAVRGAPSLAQFHGRPRPGGRGHPRLPRREPGGGAVGPPEGAPRPSGRAGSRPGARREPRSGAARARDDRGRVARRHRERPGTRSRVSGAPAGVPARESRRGVAHARPPAPRDLRAEHARRPRRERAPEAPRGRDRAGPLRLGRSHRRQATPLLPPPRADVLIEYDNTQNNANHIHSVWHDPRSNFGADLLGAHYRTDRASRLARAVAGTLRAPQESRRAAAGRESGARRS